MKQYIRRIVGLFLVVALLCAGCAGSGNKASPKNISELPEYAKLSALIGCTLEEAITKMGWQADEIVTEDDINYKTPLTVEYAGVSFRIWLLIDYASTQKISQVNYRAEYQNAPETAAKEILQVAKKLGGAIGQKTKADTQSVDIAIFEMTEAQLQETLEKKESMIKEIRWDLNEVADASIKDYMNELKDTESWQLYIERGWPPQYCLNMRISYIEELDTVYLQLGLWIYPDISQ